MRESLFIVRRPCGHIVGAYGDHPRVTERFGGEIADALRRGDGVSCEVVTAPVKIGGDCEHGGACAGLTPAFVDIVCDGPPGPESGRFIEAEGPDGASVSVGEWIARGNGYWALRIPLAVRPAVELTEQNVADMRAAVAALSRQGDVALASGVQLVLDLYEGARK